MRLPENCTEQGTGACLAQASFQKQGADVEIEVDGQAVDKDKTGVYLALAFSMDDKMGDDTIVACTLKDNKVASHLLVHRQPTKVEKLDYEGIHHQEGSYIDDRLYCKVTLRIKRSHPDVFQLEGIFRMLMAIGPLAKDDEKLALKKHEKVWIGPEVHMDAVPSKPSTASCIWSVKHLIVMLAAMVLFI
ncbi:hypothetical protein Q1695_012676 [Nippostrongylus brasiliensis]|nr:hypothetical protein Q1695_012676 [Nippostrongylus brasiliensis]